MRTMGKFTTGVLVAGAAWLTTIGVKSIPDIRRYLKMREM